MIVLNAWLKFGGLQSVCIQSRDGCCSVLIQPGVPSVQSSLFVLNSQSLVALGPVGTGERGGFFSYIFEFL